MIIHNQKNVGGFAGAHTYWFLPAQLIRGRIAAAVAGKTWTSVGKFFLFTAAQWASGVDMRMETTFRATTGEVGVRLFNETDGAAVAGSEIVTSSSTLARARSGAIALIDGKEYRMQVGVDAGAAGALVGGSIVALKP